MSDVTVLWDPDDDPWGNVQHIANNDIDKDEVEHVIDHPLARDVSRSSGRPIVFGMTRSGRMIAVVFNELEVDLVYPVTAYELDA